MSKACVPNGTIFPVRWSKVVHYEVNRVPFGRQTMFGWPLESIPCWPQCGVEDGAFTNIRDLQSLPPSLVINVQSLCLCVRMPCVCAYVRECRRVCLPPMHASACVFTVCPDVQPEYQMIAADWAHAEKQCRHGNLHSEGRDLHSALFKLHRCFSCQKILGFIGLKAY